MLADIPVKEIIVNDDSQVILKEDDGTAYADGDCTPDAGGFILDGFLGLVWGDDLNVLSGNVRILATAASAGAAEVTSYVLTDTANDAGDIIRLVYESLDLTPVDQQNHPLEKRYTIPATASIDAMGAAIAAAINADEFGPATATYTSGTDTLEITAKKVGVKIRLYSSQVTLPSVTVDTPPALPLNTYDYLKNVNWGKNFHIDRNVNWMPLPGKSYKSYYFEVLAPSRYHNNTPTVLGSSPIPSEQRNRVLTGYKLYVATAASTLITKLDLLVGDVNVAAGS